LAAIEAILHAEVFHSCSERQGARISIKGGERYGRYCPGEGEYEEVNRD